MSRKDTQKLLRQLRHEGWKVTTTGRQHYRALPPNGGPPIYMANSPSDHRALRNARAQVRRRIKKQRPP